MNCEGICAQSKVWMEKWSDAGKRWKDCIAQKPWQSCLDLDREEKRAQKEWSRWTDLCAECSSRESSSNSATPAGGSGSPTQSTYQPSMGSMARPLKAKDFGIIAGLVVANKVADALAKRISSRGKPRAVSPGTASPSSARPLRPSGIQLGPPGKPRPESPPSAHDPASALEETNSDDPPLGAEVLLATASVTKKGIKLLKVYDSFGGDFSGELPKKTIKAAGVASEVMKVVGLSWVMASADEPDGMAAADMVGTVAGWGLPPYAKGGSFAKATMTALTNTYEASLGNVDALLQGDEPNLDGPLLAVVSLPASYVTGGNIILSAAAEGSLSPFELRQRYGVVEGSRRSFVYWLLGY